jgi:hypothetical protein
MPGRGENWNTLGRACRSRDTAMAHRRGFVCRQALRAGFAVAALAAVVAGSVYVSTEATRLRALVGELADERNCLKAEGAELESRWIAQTCPTAITARVHRETDLRESPDPDFVLLTREAPAAAGAGLLQRVIAGLAGGSTANAAPAPQFVTGTMVSLTPRQRTATAAGSTP